MSIPFLISSVRLTPELCRQNKDKLFIFGDNLKGVGHGGQAIIRDEPNAFGIPTKYSPSESFTDSHWESLYKKDINEVLNKLTNIVEAPHWISGYKMVVVPDMFIGTGLASLQTEAPSLLLYLSNWFNVSYVMYGVSRNNGDIKDD